MLTSGLGGGVRLLIDIPGDVWPVVVDVGEFEIALVNLVVNARDAMPDGGTVTVTAKNITVEEGDTIPPGDYVAVTIEDTGVGIPPDVIGNVFDPFFTTKPVGKGTGLGLSQVYGFVHQAGGTVKIDSTLGQGTAVTIVLPRAAGLRQRRGTASRCGARRGPARCFWSRTIPDVASASAGLA